MDNNPTSNLLSKLSLDFKNNDLEKQFQKDTIQTSIKSLRFALFSGLVIFSLFCLNDVLLYNSVSEYFLTIRFGIGAPVILIAFMATYRKNYWKYAEILNLFAVTVAGFCVVAMTYFGIEHPEVSRISGGLAPIFLYMHVFLKLRFKHTFIAGTSILITEALIEALFVGSPFTIIISNINYMAAVNFIGIFIAYQFEKQSKSKYILTLELKTAFDEIKTLKGIVPICSNCKKIRDDQGYWNILESYIQKHSEASFSHGICPQCSEKLYGKESWYINMKKRKKTE